MTKEHFGLTHTPLGKKVKKFWDDGKQFSSFTEKFQWLLESPGEISKRESNGALSEDLAAS